MKRLLAFSKLQKDLASSSSTKKKIEILEVFKESAVAANSIYFVNSIFNLIYDKDITFGVTSENVKKFDKDVEYREYDNCIDLLEDLYRRRLTGDCALSTIQNFLKYTEEEIKEMFYCILDKDFKCGVNVKTLGKVFPVKLPFTEYVALANKYFDRADKVDFDNDVWFWSRKLDGNRLILIKRDDTVTCYSRQGKEIQTLDVLKNVIKDIPGDFVLDGECCIVDENGDEDFQEIMKVIGKKDYTIEHPVMKVFDILTEDEFFGREKSHKFSVRYSNLRNMFLKYGDILKDNFNLVEQTRVTSKEHLMYEFGNAQRKNWEGLMIRKDVPYECGRTNNLLKVKGFLDDEYIVTDYEMGDMRFVEEGHQVDKEVLASVTIKHKGYDVKVGSGFSKEQREYLHDHPEEIIGATVKVKYFEETNNMQGGISLRFPTVVYFYGKNKRFD